MPASLRLSPDNGIRIGPAALCATASLLSDWQRDLKT
jgi:hypothetical protein